MKMKQGKLKNEFITDDGNKSYHDLFKFLKKDIGFELVFHKSTIPKALSDVKTEKFIAVNAAWEAYTGYSRNEIIGFSVGDLGLTEQEQGNEIRTKIEQSIAVKSYETEIITKGGYRKEVLISLDTIIFEEDVFVLSEILDRSELKASKELLKIEKEFSQKVLSSLREGLAIFDVGGTIIEVNPALCEMTGFTKEELLVSKMPWKLWPQEEYDVIGEAFHNTLNGATGNIELIFMRKNGERFPVSLAISPLKDYSGNTTAYFSTVNDISLRVQAAEELRLAKEFSEELIASLRQGLVVMNVEGNIIDVNTSFCAITKFKKEDLLGISAPFPFLPPESQELIQSCLKGALSGKEANSEFLFIRQDGERFPATLATSFIKDKEGNVLAYFLTIEDITDRIKAEEEIRAAKDFSENLLSSMNEGLVVATIENTIKSVNPAFCEMTGFTEEELKAAGIPFPFWSPECYDSCTAYFGKLLSDGSRGSYETVYMRKNGERFPVQIMASQVKDKCGNVSGIIATIQDISEREQAQNEIRLAKEFAEQLVLSLQEGLSVMSLNKIQIDVNPALLKMTGFTREELIGKKAPFAYWPKESYQDVKDAFLEVQKGERNNFKLMLMRKNGERFPVSVSTANIKNTEGKILAHFATIKDISEQVKVETLLKETAEKSNLRKKAILKLASLVGSDFEESIRKITSLASEVMDVERVSVWEFNKSTAQIDCKNLFIRTGNSFNKGSCLIKKNNPAYFKALETNPTLNVPDALLDDRTKGFSKDYLIPNNISSMLDVCINGSHGHYGLICFEQVDSIRKWTAEEEEFAISIASLVSLMVQGSERVLAEQQLKLMNKNLSSAVTELNELKDQLQNENVYLRNEIDMVFNFEEMVYGSAAFSEILSDVEKVAPTRATVLLMGETGTGKELLARAVHNLSDRKDNPLIKVNCGAIPSELIESELFGHKKGSFTGAISDKIGKVELAHGGTLFLDEIGELPLLMQPKLLRFLQEGEIEKIGDTEVRKLDVRVIAATNKNLVEEISLKQFRQDLYFRLNVFPIIVPALRDRKEDIPILIEHFVDKFSKIYRKDIKYISDNSMRQMQQYEWPGNIRELENLIERAIILCSSETLHVFEFEDVNPLSARLITNTNLSLDEAQRLHIIKVLDTCQWKIDGDEGAAFQLKVKPSTLRDRMKKLDIKRPK